MPALAEKESDKVLPKAFGKTFFIEYSVRSRTPRIIPVDECKLTKGSLICERTAGLLVDICIRVIFRFRP